MRSEGGRRCRAGAGLEAPVSPHESSVLLICPSRGPYGVITGHFGSVQPCPVIDPLVAHRSTNSEWGS